MDNLGKDRLIEQLRHEGVLRKKDVIDAFLSVKREDFVLPEHRAYAYVDHALPIMKGQTISQPYTVAAMTEALDVQKGQKILEVGAGSGYQAAILSKIAGPSGRIFSAERISELAELARKKLSEFKNVTVIEGNGLEAARKHAPFDRIMVTAAADSVPQELIGQLKEGGKMVIPVGTDVLLIMKKKKGVEKTFLGSFAFVPLIKD